MRCKGVLCAVEFNYGFFKSVTTVDGKEHPDVFVRVSELKRRLPKQNHLMKAHDGVPFKFDVTPSRMHPGRLEATNVSIESSFVLR